MAKPDKQKRKPSEEPVSLHPLDPKEALADLMKVRPEGKEEDSTNEGVGKGREP